MGWLRFGSVFLFVLIDSTNSLLPNAFSEFGALESKAHQFSVSADNFLSSSKGSVANIVSAVSDSCSKAFYQSSVFSKCKYNVFSTFVFVHLFRHFPK